MELIFVFSVLGLFFTLATLIVHNAISRIDTGSPDTEYEYEELMDRQEQKMHKDEK